MDVNNPQASVAAKMKNFHLLYVIAQLIGLTFVIMMGIWIFGYCGGLSWTSNPKVQFNWHPLLMSIGMVFMFGNSILVYRGWRYTRKRNLKLTHASIFGSISLFVLIAFFAVYDSHVLNNPPIANFYSLHSWVGIAAIFMFIAQWFGGFISFLYPQLKTEYRERILPYHVFFGMTSFILAIIATLLGLGEKAIFKFGAKYGDLPGEAILVNLLGIFALTFGGLVLYLVTNPNYKRQPLPEDAILLTGHDESITLLDNTSDDDTS